MIFDTNRLCLSAEAQATFSTEHIIDLVKPQYYAPEDWYSCTLLTFFIDKDTNTSPPIAMVEFINSGPGDFSASLTWNWSRNNFTYNTAGGPATVEVQSIVLFPTISRSKRGKALTYSMLTVNWVLTACSMITTSAMLSWGVVVKDGIALLPVTVILSIPAIRNLYAGSPPLGIYLGTRHNYSVSPPRIEAAPQMWWDFSHKC